MGQDYATSTELSVLKETARALQHIAHQTRLRAAQERAEALNDRGVKYDFKVGQKVSFYYPPTQKEAKSAGRKPKHFSHFRGPAIIVASLSSNDTTFRIKFNNRYFERGVINLRPYNSDSIPDLYEVQEVYDVNIGDYIAVIDAVEDQRFNQTFHLSKVIDISDEKYTVWYLGTKGKNTGTAKWKLLYTNQLHQLTTQVPRHIDRIGARYTAELFEDCIVAKKLKLTKNLQLNRDSARRIHTLGLTHHILGKTYPRPD